MTAHRFGKDCYVSCAQIGIGSCFKYSASVRRGTISCSPILIVVLKGHDVDWVSALQLGSNLISMLLLLHL